MQNKQIQYCSQDISEFIWCPVSVQGGLFSHLSNNVNGTVYYMCLQFCIQLRHGGGEWGKSKQLIISSFYLSSPRWVYAEN